MSLKAFHVVFIIVTTAFAGYFGVWAFEDYRNTGHVSSLLMSIGALVTLGLLFWYFRWFLRKLKNVSYL